MIKPRITAYGGTKDERYVTISGLTPEEEEKIRGMMTGKWWVSAKAFGEGLVFHNGWLRPPDPVTDREMAPFWRKKSDAPTRVEVNIVDDSKWDSDSPSFSIQHLCGYGYTPHEYSIQAGILESFGFICLRSRRDDDGGFWEVWYLPGMWAAKGRFKKAVPDVHPHGKEETRKMVEKAVSFLCRNASFGTLDVSVQRAAMVMD